MPSLDLKYFWLTADTPSLPLISLLKWDSGKNHMHFLCWHANPRTCHRNFFSASLPQREPVEQGRYSLSCLIYRRLSLKTILFRPRFGPVIFHYCCHLLLSQGSFACFSACRKWNVCFARKKIFLKLVKSILNKNAVIYLFLLANVHRLCVMRMQVHFP